MLIRLDLPTLLLPMKAYSGFVSFGQVRTVGLLTTNSAFVISISYKFSAKVRKNTEFSLPLHSKLHSMSQSLAHEGTPYPSQLLENAVEEFAKLPGIGRKTALRLVLFLLRQESDEVEAFAQAVSRMRKEVKYCKVCHNISDTDLCPICSDQRRDSSVICVVENIRDVMAIENTQQYHGLYHVLGGIISPMEGIGPSDIEIDSLIKRVEEGGVEEVIFALSSTMEGDTTNFYISRKLASYPVKLSVIARGISVGDELEYTDEVTLGRSILNRTPFNG
jgi:recombination protein RecR